jgi:hypothetical protein
MEKVETNIQDQYIGNIVEVKKTLFDKPYLKYTSTMFIPKATRDNFAQNTDKAKIIKMKDAKQFLFNSFDWKQGHKYQINFVFRFGQKPGNFFTYDRKRNNIYIIDIAKFYETDYDFGGDIDDIFAIEIIEEIRPAQ